MSRRQEVRVTLTYCGKQHPEGLPWDWAWSAQEENRCHVRWKGAVWCPEPPRHPAFTRVEDGVEHVYMDGVLAYADARTEPDARGGRGRVRTLTYADGTSFETRLTCAVCDGEVRECERAVTVPVGR